MIFYLTNSLINEDEDEESGLRKRIALMNISMAAIDGAHIVMGDYEMLCKCKEMFSKDPVLSYLYADLLNNYSCLSIPSDITYYIEIVEDNPVERIEGDKVIAQRRIIDFVKRDASAKSKLACEDLYDCEFYRFIKDWYLKTTGRNYNVELDDLHGGGDRTYDNVRLAVGKKQPTLCIIDTDRRYPGMPIEKGKCCYKCKKFDKNRSGYRCLDIDVHEVENLLPLNYIDCLEFNGALSSMFKKHFDYLRDSDDAELILQFFDYKKGITKKSAATSPDYLSFAEKCFNCNPDINTGKSFQEYINSLEDDDKVYNMLRSSSLRDVLVFIKESKRDGNLPSPSLMPYQEKEWMRIGKEMVNWGCAPSREAVS